MCLCNSFSSHYADFVPQTALAYARVWHQVDATDRVLGKLAERIALVLMGKHKPIYNPSGTFSSLPFSLHTCSKLVGNSGLWGLRGSDELSGRQSDWTKRGAAGVPQAYNVSWWIEGDAV